MWGYLEVLSSEAYAQTRMHTACSQRGGNSSLHSRQIKTKHREGQSE